MMKSVVNIILLLSLLGVWSGEAMAAARTSNAVIGNWNANATWTCNCVPANGDTVTIVSGSTVTVTPATTTAGVTVNSGGTLTQSSTLTNTGTLSVAGTLTSTANMTITGTTTVTGTMTVGAGAVATFNNTLTVTGVTLTNNGTVTANAALSGTGGLTNGATGTLNIGTTSGITTLTATAVGNVVNYTGGAAQTIKATTYDTLNTSGAGAKTISTATVVNNTLSVTGGALTNNSTLTVTTALSGSGSLINSATGTLNIGGNSTITTLTASAVGNVVNYTGGAAQTIKATTYDTLNMSGAGVKTNSGTVTVNAALTGTALTNSATGTLNIGGSSTITTLTASAAGNTVNYTGAAQTVNATAFSNLGLSGSGAKTLTGVSTIGGNLTLSGTATATEAAALTVGGDLTIGASNTFANSTYALNVAGDYTENGTFTPGTGVFTLNGGAAVQTISGTATIGFANLTVSNTGGILLAQNVTVTSAIIGTVTLISTCPNNYTITSNNGGTVQESCTPVCNAPPNIPVGVTVTCVCDNFGRANLNPSTIFGGNWALSYGSTDAALTVPYINAVTGFLRLTENTANNAKAATVPSIFPAAGNYISVEFNHYAYQGGTTGADGIAVTLSDYSIPAVPGGFGGSLGYAQRTDSTPNPPGFAGGWVGVALDEYGNFQNPTEGRVNGPGAIIQSVGVRGPGSGINGYRYMGGTASSPGGYNISADSASATPNPGYKYQVIVDARNVGTGTINVSVNRDATTKNGNTYTSLFGPFNAYTEANYALGQGWISQIVPNFWKISFTGSTGGSNNVHEIDGLRICAQSIAPGTGGSASGFSAIDSAYPGSPPAYPNFQTGHIYTKLVGSAFNLYVAALTPTAISTAYSSAQSRYVQVKFVDNSASAGNLCGSNSARTCNSACTSQAAVEAGATQIATFIKPSATGVASPSPAFTLNSSYQNLVAVMQECTDSTCAAFTATTPACSADSFSVRPTSIATVTTSNATNTTTAGLPKFKAGSDNFNLTATTTGVAGFPSKYTGVLKINSALASPVAPATVAGVVSGTFAAATSATPSSTAIGNVFTYSEVGDFSLLANGVYDGVSTPVECTTPGLTTAQCDTLKAATWTGVDSVSTQGDCVADSFSNVINASGQYGCNFGYLSATGVFGRFIPDHFAVSGGSLVNRSDICPLGTNCPSTFTYIGEPMNAVFTLTAQAAGNNTTKNYVGNNSAGQLAKLNPAALGNPLGLAVAYAAVSSAAAGAGATTVSVDTTVGFVAGDALWIPGAGAAGAALNATVASLTSNTITLSTPIVTAVPLGTNIERDLTASLNTSTAATGSFAAGVAANISAPLTVNRGTTNWYPALNVGIAPVEGDSVLMSPLNLDAAYVAGNDHALIGSTDVRYGSMKLPNAHGSELLQLPIAVTVQYWNGLNYVTNTSDSVTSFASGTVLWSNCQKLSATSTWPSTMICTPPTSVSPASVVFINGTAVSFILTKPGVGNTGSVDMTTSAPSYLPSNKARATFGVYKGANEFIYLRENY